VAYLLRYAGEQALNWTIAQAQGWINANDRPLTPAEEEQAFYWDDPDQLDCLEPEN
jgi:hypothetical protein